MAIRYDKKLNQEINRVIKNFNQKIARLEKQERDLIPSKITKAKLKEDVFTRTELRRKLKELERFGKRGVEDIITTSGGARLTKYDYENIKRENTRIKRNITRELTRLSVEKPKIFGKQQVATFMQMGDPQYLNLVARRKMLDKDISKMNIEELERFKTLLEKTQKNKQYMNSIFKENYFDMLTKLGYYFDYDQSKINYLRQRLMTLKPNDFLKLFREDKSIRAILDYYPVVTGSFDAMNPDDIRDDVISLYDNLIDNIDDILKDYA